MHDPVLTVSSPDDIAAVARRLREQVLIDDAIPPLQVIEILERWGAALRGPAVEVIPGVAFLRLWLRRNSLEPMLLRELGADALQGSWREESRARLGVVPLGVVGHWPAGNIEIQPMLSMSCALLGGNACLVRAPSGLVDVTRELIARLHEVDSDAVLTKRIAVVAFDHDRLDLQRAMAMAVDGAMIWGGDEAVSQVRALPFPHWARVAVFGPRLSIAAMDRGAWSDETQWAAWCRRLARDVWQFDQQACSSPQTLFLERGKGCDVTPFVDELKRAFIEENQAHPRHDIHPALSSAIALARASWLIERETRRAVFPPTPDWTILLGEGSEIPTPTQGRTLTVLLVDDLLEPISKFRGQVQTLGVAIKDPDREAVVARKAAKGGVDRIVKLGRMHVFGSPWDGADLVRPMTRVIRHIPSFETTL
jgi:acyl-CoA reductase-like NAD-dependent aldehyde dehydrogenase